MWVKIDVDNTTSVKIFEGVQFRRTSEKPNYFDELELRWDFDPETSQRLWQQIDDNNCEEGLYVLDSRKDVLNIPI